MRDDPLEVLQNLMAEHGNSKNLQNHLIALIECLYKDLEMGKNTIASLQNQMEKLLKSETFGITSKYIALKGEQATLKNQISSLKNEIEDLNTQIIAKDLEMKKILSVKDQEMQIDCNNQLKQKDEQIKQKDEEIQNNKRNHEKRIQELHNEIETAAAFSAMQLDQIESDYRTQLKEISKKFKDCNNTCGTLRTELYIAKEQCNNYKLKIAELQKQHKEPLNLSHSSNQKSLNINSTFLVDDCVVPEKTSKYQPLEIASYTHSEKKTPVPVFRGNRSSLGESSRRTTRSSLPPLIQLKDVNTNKQDPPVIKKRKLYNPDDLAYLSADEDDM